MGNYKRAFFWNLIAKSYAKNPVVNQEAYRYKLSQTQKYLSPTARVLEVGCGTGTTALYHAPAVERILALDVSRKMLRIAQEKALVQGIENVEFRCADLARFEFPPEAFDVALAMSILHLVPDRDALLERLYEALKPGGCLITSTACVREIAPYLRWVVPIGHFLWLLPQVRSFTQEELKSSMSQAGFTLLEVWQPSPKEATFIIAQKGERS